MTSEAGTPLRLSAIIPATNRPTTLGQCLEAIRSAEAPPDELIVIEDSALDHPATARNAGCRQATGAILVFIDADVTVHPDVFVRFRQRFSADERLSAVIGSYDDRPTAGSIVSTFRNLLHHHVHQEGAGEAGTFWAGLGAMRREVFESAGGFQRHPIEDIELGMRVVEAGGHILLDPSIQGTHLKCWTFGSMVRTDLFVRGIPWVGLLIKHRRTASRSGLNLGWRHRISAMASLGLPVAIVLRRPLAAFACAAVLVGLNLAFYRLLWRRMGPVRSLGGIAMHVVHHLVSVVAVVIGIVVHVLHPERVRGEQR